MGPLLLLFLSSKLFYTINCSSAVSASRNVLNAIGDKLNDYSLFAPPELPDESYDFFYDEEDIQTDDIPLITTDEDKTEMKFYQPLESVNIDYDRNTIVAKLYKTNTKSMAKNDAAGDKSKTKSLHDNFIRFGKRSYEEFPLANSFAEDFVDKNPKMRLERSQQTARDARGDNFMRFGRSVNTKNDFMRFGRAAAGDNFMRFGRSASQNFMRFGRTPSKDFMRFGRIPPQDFMRFQDFRRFGRTPPSQDFMRFGRTAGQDFRRIDRTPPSQDFMRFGRSNQDNFIRFGKNPHKDFMRFGRNSLKIPVNTNFMRYSRPDNFMRFGRAPPQPNDNFIRFGKSLEKSNDENSSQPILGKNELKQAVKLIHEADKNADNGNPVDKAIKVLFDKKQHDEHDKDHSEELANREASIQHEDNNNDLESDMDYLFKISK